jgi:hypothetical protein
MTVLELSAKSRVGMGDFLDFLRSRRTVARVVVES